jgi:hypothetical protein
MIRNYCLPGHLIMAKGVKVHSVVNNMRTMRRISIIGNTFGRAASHVLDGQFLSKWTLLVLANRMKSTV